MILERCSHFVHDIREEDQHVPVHLLLGHGYVVPFCVRDVLPKDMVHLKELSTRQSAEGNPWRAAEWRTHIYHIPHTAQLALWGSA